MSIDHPEGSRPLPDRPNLRHLKDQAKDLLRAGAAASITDAQFKIARLYGFASWPKLKAHIDSLKEMGQLKQAIDTNDLDRVKALMTRNPSLHTCSTWLRPGRAADVGGRMPCPMGITEPGETRDGDMDDRATGRTCTRAATDL